MFGRGLKPLAIASTALIVLAFGLVFFYAPNEADQGFIQKIFYVHVPLAIVALGGFVVGGIYGARMLWTGDRSHDMRSYVVIHQSLIFGVAALITGSIWAKAAWGHWWLWDEPTLVSFLIVFLLYACYQPLRFSIEDSEKQARYAAVFSVVAGAFVPLNFLAVRMAQSFAHPRTLSSTNNLPGSMALTFLIALIAMACLFTTLVKFELVAKATRMRLGRLRRQLSGEPTLSLTPRRSAAPTSL